MPTVSPIAIDGLRDFQRALKDIDGESQKELRLVLNDAAEIVASGARRLVPRRSGRAAGSVKVASQQRSAQVKAGGSRAPYYGWLDFGGSVGRKRSIRRAFLTDGRYIYPTYNARKLWFRQRLERGLIDLAKRSGFEVE